MQAARHRPSSRAAPTTHLLGCAGFRGRIITARENLWAGRPYRPLTEGLRKTGGRNNQGRITSWHRGGGTKRLYRLVSFCLVLHTWVTWADCWMSSSCRHQVHEVLLIAHVSYTATTRFSLCSRWRPQQTDDAALYASSGRLHTLSQWRDGSGGAFGV